jgi:uncharacterized membrane protein
MLILKWLHIAAMFAAVTLLFAPDIVFYRAAASRDVTAMRRIGPLSKAVVLTGVVLFFVGLGLGVAAAVVGPFDLTDPWLIAAYALVAAIIFLGAVIEQPHLNRLADAAERSGEEPSAELERLIRSPVRYLSLVSAALYVTVIYVMVAKPFGT